jgi:hypothetical protein
MTTRRRPALEVGADDATVDLIDRPGDVGSPFGCQERHQLPDFGRLTQAAQRDRRGDMGRRQGRPPHLPRPRPRRRRRRRLRLDPRPHAVDPSPPRRTTRPVHLLGLRFTRAEQARHAHRVVSAALPQSPGLSGHLSTYGPLGPCPRTWWYVRWDAGSRGGLASSGVCAPAAHEGHPHWTLAVRGRYDEPAEADRTHRERNP